MRAVNLMPRDERQARFDGGRLPLVAAAGGIVVVTAAAFLLSTSASSSAKETRAELQAVEAAIAQLPQPGESPVNVGTFVQERSDRVAALAAALTSRTPFDRLLRDVSYVLPENAWLTNLEATAPVASGPVDPTAPPPVAAVSGVTIQGATYSHDGVAAVLARLSVVPSLADVRLTSTAIVEPEVDETEDKIVRRQKPFVTFNISASVRTGATP
jgi:Tfp pilus assembly protein PilN